MSLVLVAIVALPALAALTGALGAERAGRVEAVVTGVTFALALSLAVHVAFEGPVSALVERGDGRAVAGLYADRVAVVLLLLVCGVSAMVQAFATRYLRGDARAGRFFAATGLLTAATAAMVTSATLTGLAAAWTLAGVALCLMLGMYSGLAAAREGVRRTVRAFVIGDAALWVAVAIATASWGDLDLRRLGVQAPGLVADSTVLALVACLLVVAALARSAQVPLQRWLPATLAAPTPVSALLHAGVVNAGGVLLVRLSPLFGASRPATHLAFFAGAATVLYGTALMLAKPDIKGALAHSTMGQMGFMIMTCGMGAFAAAIFHLVAHGMYKATLFLGSGAAVHRHVRHVKAPPVRPLRPSACAAAMLFAVAGPAAALLAVTAVLHPHMGGRTGSGALLVFAWASGAWASWGWLRRHPSQGGALAALAAILIAAPAYVALLRGVTGFLAPALTGAGQATAAPWLLAVVVAVMAGMTLIRLTPPGHARLGGLHKTLYVLALSAGHAVGGTRRGRSRGRARGWVAREFLVPRSEGARP